MIAAFKQLLQFFTLILQSLHTSNILWHSLLAMQKQISLTLQQLLQDSTALSVWPRTQPTHKIVDALGMTLHCTKK